MFGSALATSIAELVASRFLVGIGIGTVLATMAALTAEYAPARYRTFAVGFLQAGYPVGATLTGFIVARQIDVHGWQAMLLGAAILCTVSLPLVWVLLPESIDFLLSRSVGFFRFPHLVSSSAQPTEHRRHPVEFGLSILALGFVQRLANNVSARQPIDVQSLVSECHSFRFR